MWHPDQMKTGHYTDARFCLYRRGSSCHENVFEKILLTILRVQINQIFTKAEVLLVEPASISLRATE